MRDVIAERYSDVYATYSQELNRIQEVCDSKKLIMVPFEF